MSIRARRPRRRMSPFQAYYHTAAWYARRHAVRTRAGSRCEFCRLRRMEHVHHRTYAHFGQEPLGDLMGVCALCHRTIHRLVRGHRPVTCAPGSLLARGDSGLGHTRLWNTYLAGHHVRAA